MQDRLTDEQISTVFQRALSTPGLIDREDDTSVIFYDLSRLDGTLKALRTAFPPGTLHAVAVKANQSVEILKRVRSAGFGAEVASSGELHLALAAGFPVESVVFDSPAKTYGELEFALKAGVRINANSLCELARIDSLYSRLGSHSAVGVRINPGVGRGSIEMTSLSVQDSKFGVPLQTCRGDIAGAFSQYPWLRGLHLHVGSQGMSRDQLLNGVSAAYGLFLELGGSARVSTFDLGGGLPAKYRESDRPTTFSEYASFLRQRCPALFSSDVALVTEFGRSVHASCGWVASRVEYVTNHNSDTSTLIVHVGADMFLRNAYCPDDWHHDTSVCDSSGRLRVGPQKLFHVAGPLCFAGDYLDRSVSLPADVHEGDHILIHDAGAYTFSMWSLYNSRQFPKVVAYEDGGQRFICLRRRQPIDDVVQFWSKGDAP